MTRWWLLSIAVVAASLVGTARAEEATAPEQPAEAAPEAEAPVEPPTAEPAEWDEGASAAPPAETTDDANPEAEAGIEPETAAPPEGDHEEPREPGSSEATVVVDAEDTLPAAAARYFPLVEPLGGAPSPWIALSAGVDGGATMDGEGGWTALRVHVPVARHYGSVDARLVGTFDGEGLVTLAPEIVLRGVPLQMADRRAVLGFSFHFTPTMRGPDPLMFIGGGLMGGFLGEIWFAWAQVAAGAEVLQRGQPEILATLAGGLRLPHGFRPQVEIDFRWIAPDSDEISLAVRPGLRYWLREWIGVGVSADIWVTGPAIETSSIRIDVIGHAPE